MLTRIKINYNTDDGMPDDEFDRKMQKSIEEETGLVYDGSGMELESRTRDLFFYAKKEAK